MRDAEQIRDPAQLADLSVRGLFSMRAPATVSIKTTDVPVARARAWEAHLSRLQGACGCEQGGVGLLAGVAVYAIYLFARPDGIDGLDSFDIWAGVAVLCVSTSLGKVLGLRRARRELRKAVREIRSQWTAQQSGTAGALGSADYGTLASPCCGHSNDRPPYEPAPGFTMNN